MSAAPMALGRTPDCYPSPSGLGSRLADGPPGLDEVCSQRQPFHSQKDNLDKSVSGEATTRPEQGVTWAFKYELALSSSKRVGAWEARTAPGFRPRSAKTRAAQIILIIGSVRIAGVFSPKWETVAVGVFRDHR